MCWVGVVEIFFCSFIYSGWSCGCLCLRFYCIVKGLLVVVFVSWMDLFIVLLCFLWILVIFGCWRIEGWMLVWFVGSWWWCICCCCLGICLWLWCFCMVVFILIFRSFGSRIIWVVFCMCWVCWSCCSCMCFVVSIRGCCGIVFCFLFVCCWIIGSFFVIWLFLLISLCSLFISILFIMF